MREGPFAIILARLEELGCRPRRRGRQWVALCPNHPDRCPSLSLREAEDGRVLLKCMAGCDTQAVLARLSIGWDALFPPEERRNGGDRHQQQQGKRPQVQEEGGWPTEDAAFKWLHEKTGCPRVLAGVLGVRYQDEGLCLTWPGIQARMVRRGPRASWTWEAEEHEGQRPDLWPLPIFLARSIWLTEGPTDCLALRAAGLPAYASVKGAGRDLGLVLKALKEAGMEEVVIVYDLDGAGRSGAEKAAKAARAAGLRVREVELPSYLALVGGKDVCDLLATLGGDVRRLREVIEALAQAAPNFTSAIIPPGVGSKVPTAAELRAEAPKELPWLPFLGREGFVWEGSVTLLSSYPKTGKSTLLAWLALEWAKLGRKVRILSEEGLEIWRRRLSAMPDGPWERVTIQPALGLGIAGLCQVLRDVDADIFLVDTLRKVAPLGSFRDSAEVNAAFVAILSARQEAQAKRGRPITLVLAHHDRKSSEGAEEGQRVADSHVVFGSVDTVLELVRGEGSRRLVRGWGRLVEPPTVIIEMAEDGALRILGSPQEVALEEVKEKVLGVLEEAEGWLTTKEAREALPTPRPSDDQVRRALLELARGGLVERAPPLSEGTKQGVTYRWRLAPGQPNLTSDDRGCDSGSKVATAPPADLFAQTLAGEFEAEEDEPQAQAEREEASPPWAHLPLWVQTVLGEFCEADGEGLRWREPPEGTAQGATGPPPRPCVECGALATTAMRRPAYGGVDDSDSRR